MQSLLEHDKRLLDVPRPDHQMTRLYDLHWVLGVVDDRLHVLLQLSEGRAKGKKINILAPWLAYSLHNWMTDGFRIQGHYSKLGKCGRIM